MSMSLIDDFISQYNKEFDFYQKLSQIIASKIEDQLIKRGIKAIVSNRAKRPESLYDKLSKRQSDKKYKSFEDISADIVDLAGVRISLYFPSDRKLMQEIIQEVFEVEETKEFPSAVHAPKYSKRFSGYWASHYRLKLKKDDMIKRYADILCEVQVASVLMHAWSEVEHDLVYKPFTGDLSDEELSILDEINGLVLSGEIALERLQKAMSDRTQKKTEVTDKYELTNLLINNIDKSSLTKLGNTAFLSNLLKTNQSLDVDRLLHLIHNLNLSSEDTVTDQILNMFLFEDLINAPKDFLKKYFLNLHVPEKKVSSFESFVKCWVVLEKAVRAIHVADNLPVKKHIVPDFKILTAQGILTETEGNELQLMRQFRNNLLHGIATQNDFLINDGYKALNTITEKVINNIKDERLKKDLHKELKSIQ